jgi:hypothetical protein
MIHTLTHAGRWARLRAPLLALVVLAGACDSADNLATTDPTVPVEGALLDSAAADSLAPADSTADSTAADTLGALDSLPVGDSLTAVDLADIEASEAAFRGRGVPYGPYGLWRDYTRLKSFKAPFTTSLSYSDPRGILKQIAAARANNQRLILAMTGGGHALFKTRGKFDMGKWKRRMDQFNRKEIRAAVAQGVRDGTIIMNNIMDEPNVKSWGGVMTKARLDEMARYVKRIFPTLPVGVAVVHSWRPQERFRAVDAIITQYSWYMGNVKTWKNEALKQARLNGTSVAFALNILNGGIQSHRSRACPLGTTGGRGTMGRNHPACRMTATQVREWSKILGASSCAMIMWRYDDVFMSKAANQKAFRDASAALKNSSARSCRRGKA